MKFLKRVVNNRWAHRRRKYFLRWKKESERLTLANFINDFGQTRKEWFQRVKEIKNYKDLLLQDGFTDKEIADIIAKDDQKYLNIVERALCRLYLQNQKSKAIGMNLVPFCFDKLRKFQKERKVYRYYIKKMNHIIERKANLREGFVRWMSFTWHRHN